MLAVTSTWVNTPLAKCTYVDVHTLIRATRHESLLHGADWLPQCHGHLQTAGRTAKAHLEKPRGSKMGPPG